MLPVTLKYQIDIMQTTKGELIESNEIYSKVGIDPDAKLSNAQIARLNKYGLDVDSATQLFNSRSLDSNRISKGEMLARGSIGESLILTPEDSSAEPLTEGQTSMARKLRVAPELARRARDIDEQSFIPKAEREAELEKRKGWGK